tara:strand:- start:363 stop:716 length:354 start_codon:yes stop_codon:yes gene_type:complete
MANTYTWDCKTVDCYPEHDNHNDVVYNVHWRLNAVSDQTHEVDGEDVHYTAYVYGTHSVNADDIENFVPFADLTNEMVSGWVVEGMGEEQVQSLQDGLDAQINEQINPTTETKTIGG